MKTIKRVIELIILLIALGAALYTQRVPILDWVREMSEPPLPEAISYETVTEETIEGEVGIEEEGAEEAIEEALPPTQEEASVTEVGEEEEVVVEEDPESDEETLEPTLEGTILPASINLAVPFTSQAPHGSWTEPYQEACEEASVYMVEQYYAGEREGVINPDKADLDLLNIVAFEEELFGYYEDTTAEQTGTFAELMFGFSNVILIEDPTVEDIKAQLAAGYPVIVPAAGRLLGNPYFTAPGPVYHMLVIRGYTVGNKFIVNDPGTRHGEAYLYDFETIMSAMHDWNGGGEITGGRKVVLVIQP